MLYDHTGILGLCDAWGNFYYAKKDAQGNISALLDGIGNLVVEYKYDAWGNHKVLNPNGTENTEPSFIGNVNPFRYRGYYFDTNTGLYYLQSRFYDPEIGRFLNADTIDYLEPDTVNGLNLYAYCGNNPVMYYDPFGTSLLAIGLILLGATIVGGIVGGVSSYNQGYRGWDVVKYTILGAGIGLAIGGAIIATGAVAVGAVAAMSGTASAMFLGVPVLQAFAIGALAVDAFAYVIAPLYGVVDMAGIEYAPIAPYNPPSYNSNHPVLK